MLWGGCNTVHYLYIRYDRKFFCLVLMLNGTNFVNGIPLTHLSLWWILVKFWDILTRFLTGVIWTLLYLSWYLYWCCLSYKKKIMTVSRTVSFLLSKWSVYILGRFLMFCVALKSFQCLAWETKSKNRLHVEIISIYVYCYVLTCNKKVGTLSTFLRSRDFFLGHVVKLNFSLIFYVRHVILWQLLDH